MARATALIVIGGEGEVLVVGRGPGHKADSPSPIRRQSSSAPKTELSPFGFDS